MPAWQLRLLRNQVARVPFSVLLVDLFVFWYLTSRGLTSGMLAWLLASAAVQAGRWLYVRRLDGEDSERDARFERGLLLWFFAVGVSRLWPIALAATRGSVDDLYMMTLIHIGLAAGGVGSVVGTVRSYLAWALPVVTALVAMWLAQRNSVGVGLALLIVLMFGMLTAYVRDFGLALRQQETLSESLRVERDRAESAIAARNRFFAAASHDLRQPLSVLSWYGDAVAVHARNLDHAALQQIAAGIARAVDRAEPLVRKYLDIARFEAGAIPVKAEPVDVPRLLHEVVAAHALDAEQRGLQLQVKVVADAPSNMPPHAPPGTPSLCAFTDLGLVQSALDNLVGNALKFTPSGSVTLSARVVPSGRHGRVRIEVHDTGIGIAQSEQRHIFEDFYQVGNPQRSASAGVGLGLAIARRQLQLLGAEIELRSAPEKGSSFAFEVPGYSGAAQPSVAPAAEPAGETLRRVLIIENEPDVRESLSLMLGSLGWPVVAVAGPDEALRAWDAARGFIPDLLLVDFRLDARLNGPDALAVLRSMGLHAPAIFITGDTSPERLREQAASGVPVLHKPVSLAALLQAIKQLPKELTA